MTDEMKTVTDPRARASWEEFGERYEVVHRRARKRRERNTTATKIGLGIMILIFGMGYLYLTALALLSGSSYAASPDERNLVCLLFSISICGALIITVSSLLHRFATLIAREAQVTVAHRKLMKVVHEVESADALDGALSIAVDETSERGALTLSRHGGLTVHDADS